MVRIINGLVAPVLILGALVALVYLPEAFASYSREPEDAVLLVLYGAVGAYVGAICVWNVFGHAESTWKTAANVVALLPGVFLYSLDDGFASIVASVTVIGPVSYLLSEMHGRLARP